MKLFFFGGTNSEQLFAGLLADHCPFCQTLTVFTVIEHHEGGHVYFIPVLDDVVTRFKTCHSCGRSLSYLPEAHHKLAQQGDIDLLILELVSKTNPRLAEEVVVNGGAALASEDPELLENVEKLGECREMSKVLELLFKLNNWDNSSQDERLALTVEVDELCAEFRTRQRLLDIVSELSADYPEHIGCIYGLITASALLLIAVLFGHTPGWKMGGIVLSLLIVLTPTQSGHDSERRRTLHRRKPDSVSIEGGQNEEMLGMVSTFVRNSVRVRRNRF